VQVEHPGLNRNVSAAAQSQVKTPHVLSNTETSGSYQEMTHFLRLDLGRVLLHSRSKVKERKQMMDD
jgi:hypothetical protein